MEKSQEKNYQFYSRNWQNDCFYKNNFIINLYIKIDKYVTTF